MAGMIRMGGRRRAEGRGPMSDVRGQRSDVGERRSDIRGNTGMWDDLEGCSAALYGLKMNWPILIPLTPAH